MAIGLTTGRYRIVDRIATGGMGEVYRAVMGAMGGVDKQVALKVVRSRMARDPELAALFVEEAKVAMTLSHANVVQAFDVGRIDDRLFLALELVDGVDLAELIRACFDRLGQPIPHRHVIFIAVEALKGLDYAHRRKDANGRALSIIHRDVSPGNVLISFEGEVKVADFGIAKSAMREVSSVAGTVKGKVPYMAPEQLRGEVVDRRADLYALGAVLYEMLTGVRVVELARGPAAIPDALAGTHRRPREIIGSIPEELERIVEKALELRLEDRYPNAASMRQDLEQHALRQAYLLSSTDLADFVTEVVGDKEAHRRARTGTGMTTAVQGATPGSAEMSNGSSLDSNRDPSPRDSDDGPSFDALLGAELEAVESPESFSVFTTSERTFAIGASRVAAADVPVEPTAVVEASLRPSRLPLIVLGGTFALLAVGVAVGASLAGGETTAAAPPVTTTATATPSASPRPDRNDDRQERAADVDPVGELPRGADTPPGALDHVVSGEHVDPDDSPARPTMRAREAEVAPAGTARLLINTDPWSNVYVDGQLIGPTPIVDFEVRSGRHRLTFRNESLGLEASQTLEVAAGERKRVSRTLTR